MKASKKESINNDDSLLNSSNTNSISDLSKSNSSRLSIENAIEYMIKFREKPNWRFEEGIVKTSILDPYMKLCPTFKKINHNNQNVQIYKVILNNNLTFILKILTIDKNMPGHIYSLLLEFYIGRTFSLICDKIAKTIDMKEIDTGEDNNYMRIELLTEYGGESARILAENEEIIDPVKMGYQLLEILVDMEEYGIAHFDIKPHNIVWDAENSKLKLIDFGTSMSFYLFNEKVNEPLGDNYTQISGLTLQYAPPELIQYKNEEIAKEIIPHKVDVFCFGMTFAELLLYRSNQELGIRRPGNKLDYSTYIINLKDSLLANKDDIWVNLIMQCLVYYQTQRPQAKEIKKMFDDIITKNKISINISQTNKREEMLKYISSSLKTCEPEITVLFCNKLLKNHGMEQGKDFELLYLYQTISAAYLQLFHFRKHSEYLLKYSDRLFGLYGSSCAQAIRNSYLMGSYLESENKHRHAISMYEKVLSFYIPLFGEYHNETVYLYKYIVNCYSSIKDYQKVELFCSKIKKILQKGKQDDYLLHYDIYHTYTLVYINLKDFNKAIEYVNKALEFARKLPSGGIIKSMECFNILGFTYMCKNDYKNARKAYLEAEFFGFKLCAESQKYLALTQRYIGNLYFKAHEYNLAIDYLLKSEVIFKKLYGGNNILVSMINEKIGKIYECVYSFNCAIEYFQRSLKIRACVYGKNSKSISVIYSYIGDQYKYLKYYKNAIDCYKMGELILKSHLLDTELRLSDHYYLLFTVYIETKQYDLACQYYLKNVEITSKHKDMHPCNYIQSLGMLLHLHVIKKQLRASLETFTEIEKFVKKNPQECEVLLPTIYCDFAEILTWRKDNNSAISYYLKAKKCYDNTNREDPFFICKLMIFLGKAYLRKRDNIKSIGCFNEIVQHFQELSVENSQLAIALFFLGNELHAKRR